MAVLFAQQHRTRIQSRITIWIMTVCSEFNNDRHHSVVFAFKLTIFESRKVLITRVARERPVEFPVAQKPVLGIGVPAAKQNPAKN